MSFDAKKYFQERLKKLQQRISKYETEQFYNKEFEEKEEKLAVLTSNTNKPKCCGSINISLDDVIYGIKSDKLILDRTIISGLKLQISKYESMESPKDPLIKVILKKTATIALYEQNSVSVLSNSEEGRKVDEDNERYQYLTEGLGRKRYCYTKETQTSTNLQKTRSLNTDSILVKDVPSYVSNFEMFDTYKDIEQTTQSVNMDGKHHIQVTTYKLHGVDEFETINQTINFKLALMMMLRILASNTYEWEQRRFRNMIRPNPLSMHVEYLYCLKYLWSFVLGSNQQNNINGFKYIVTDMNWCPNNADILLVSYNVSHVGESDKEEQLIESSDYSHGSVAVWNIKNPVNTERFYNFHAPVTAATFSPFIPKLIAIGLYDGSIYVYDISDPIDYQVAVSQRHITPYYEPVTAIQWIPHSDGDHCHYNNSEPFLVLYRDSSVISYSMIRSPYLMGHLKIKLNRVEMSVEGLSKLECYCKSKPDRVLANRHPHGINLCLDVTDTSIYYVLTDEGCLHKCSITYSDYHLEALQLHEAGINAMEFSPWSPQLFLTCGNDWCIRIWITGILRPIITLKYHMRPILKASWSTTHSTVIVSITRNSIDIWDLKRSILKPLFIKTIQLKMPGEYTIFSLSNCGRSIAVGNNQGQVDVLAFDDMPFPPYYQCRHLKRTIYDIISADPELLRDVKSLGYFAFV